MNQELPQTSVGAYVADLAARHGIGVVRTKLDAFAEMATSHAGDDVQLDEVGQTLVALRERGLITGAEMNRLMLTHLRERKNLSQGASRD